MKNTSGFTIVELLLGVALFIAVAGSMAFAFLKSVSINESGQMMVEAMYRLQQKAEEIKNFDYQASVEETRLAYDGQSFQLANFPDNVGTIEMLNVAGVPPGQLYRLSIQLSWLDKDGHVMGEDSNLDGVLNLGEDINGNNRLDSPAQIVTYVSP
jgi:type II secretory pathway pseudopilin PulG